MSADNFFVSNFDLANRMGGFDGLGGKIYDLMKQYFPELKLIDQVSPPVNRLEKYQSIIFRKLYIPANFPVFSSGRLKSISSVLSSKIPSGNGFIVFHGATPWVDYKPAGKYYAFTDCSFETYISSYHDRAHYSKRDIKRIIKAEEKFFANAEQVFFTSQWAIDETLKDYELKGENFLNIRQGPSMEISENAFSTELPRKQFVFIGTDFLGKGGAEICKAFVRFQEVQKAYKLIIIGQRPPDEFLSIPNIEFLGYVNKSTPEGRAKIAQIYQQSKALLLLTKKDISPLVLIEAGLHGCPTIANNQGAIPEMIKENVSGFMISTSAEDCLHALNRIAELDDTSIIQMRKKTKDYYAQRYAWSEVMTKMMSKVVLAP